VGYPAFAAWIIAEAWNFYDNATKRPKTGPSNLSLFKSLCQVIGALIIWIFVILTLRYEVVRLLSGLFWTGAAIALLGTLLGIAAGIWNLRRK
jgi:glucan phosphoethanolaminetransferase (alkaline phosphatase superfamily)